MGLHMNRTRICIPGCVALMMIALRGAWAEPATEQPAPPAGGEQSATTAKEAHAKGRFLRVVDTRARMGPGLP
jgi:hypothetical protein